MMRLIRISLVALLTLITSVAHAEQLYTVTTNTLNVRSQPTTSSEVIGQLHMNDAITSEDSTEDGWLRVEYNGMEGYVSAGYVSYVGEAESTPSIAEEEMSIDYFLNRYRFDVAPVNNLLFTILIACLILALYLLCRNRELIYYSKGLYILAHFIAMAAAVLVIWQGLAPKDGVFMNNIVWFLDDHSWLRKALYFIGFGTVLILYAISLMRLFGNVLVMPRSDLNFWNLGLVSWPFYIIILILCNIFGWSMETPTIVFLAAQALFILGMLIYYAVKGYLLWALLLIPSYLVTSLGFTVMFAIFIALVIVITIAILIIWAFANNRTPDLDLRWSSEEGCYIDNNTGRRYDVHN